MSCRTDLLTLSSECYCTPLPWYCPVAGSVWSELWPRLSHDTWLNQYPIITITSPSPPQVSDLSLYIGRLCHSSAPIGQYSSAHQPCPITSISSIRTSQHQSHLHCPLTQSNQWRFCPKIDSFYKSINVFMKVHVLNKRGFSFLTHGCREEGNWKWIC